MLADEELAQAAPQQETVLTIGVFDGVHLGHRHLLSRLKKEAKRQSALSGVVTFRRHPREVVAPGAPLSYLTSLEDKVRLIQSEGVDLVVPLTFDKELAALTARQFMIMLKKYLRVRALVVGPDFALGRGRQGTPDALRLLGQEMGFTVTVAAPYRLDGEVVSSTAVRQALAAGEVSRVVKLTGRPYSIKGRVVAGTGTGRRLGFPTANLKIDPGWAIPADGVYATLTHIGGRVFKSLTSIGLRPTFGGKERTVETHILDFADNIYGQDVVIGVVEKLRNEKKFADVEELKRQIAEDVVKGKEILASAIKVRVGRRKTLAHDR